MPNISHAVILSAGLGTRLRSVTGEALPKVMVPVGGKPLLEDHIAQFKKHGVSDFFINLHHLPDSIKNYFGDGKKWGVRVTYAYEPELRGTAGGIKNFEGKLRGDFFVIYGDMVSRVNYRRMAEAFAAKSGAIGLVAVGDAGHPEDSDLAEIDQSSRILRIHKKPHASLPKNYRELLAAYIFNEKILRYIPEDRPYAIDHDLLPEVIAKGEAVFGYETKEYLMDIGTPERYAAAQRLISK